MRLELISYGNGTHFDPAKFEPIENRAFIKPYGGFWASPIDAEYGWDAWCKDNDFGDLSHNFTFALEGRVLVINTAADLETLPWYQPHASLPLWTIDFEEVAKTYDAIYLTAHGERATRWGIERNLYGWDCESVLILNPACVIAEVTHA